jgi:REP element-mobilizing transposase RayT
VWATKHRQLLLEGTVEQFAFAELTRQSVELDSPILAVNGIPDHVHLAVNIHPRLSVADWVKKLKGATSFLINQRKMLPQHFAWQESYGVLTFGQRQLPFIVAYINRQKEHHQTGTTHITLEKTEK